MSRPLGEAWSDAVASVQTLHSPRYFDGDGYGWKVCAECRQSWPCATAQAIDEAFGVDRHPNGNVKTGCRDWPFGPNSDFDGCSCGVGDASGRHSSTCPRAAA